MAGYLPFAGLLGSGKSYDKDYGSALALNAANYNNIYGGFQDLLAAQQTGNQAIESGYTERRNNAMQLLAGLEQGQREDIQAGATRATSQNSQDLIGRGLSNSTVQSTLARGVEADKNRAVNNLVGQMAGTKANIYSALEGDRLNAMNANRDALNRIAQQRLGFQERVSAPYPDAGKYAALAQQAGANRMAGAGMGPQGGGLPRQMPGGGGMQGGGGIGPEIARQQGLGRMGGGPAQWRDPPAGIGAGVAPGMGGIPQPMPPGIAQGGMDGGYGAILGGIGSFDPCKYGGCGDATMGSGGVGDYSRPDVPNVRYPNYVPPDFPSFYTSDGVSSGIPMPYGLGGFGPPPGVTAAYGNTNDMIPYGFGGYAEGW